VVLIKKCVQVSACFLSCSFEKKNFPSLLFSLFYLFLKSILGRTLPRRGIKKVEVSVQSVNATTHSYTIQPLLSYEGQLVGPLLIVLPEKDGTFGPRVKKTMFLPDNVMVEASKSGKCTTEIMKKWLVRLSLNCYLFYFY